MTGIAPKPIPAFSPPRREVRSRGGGGGDGCSYRALVRARGRLSLWSARGLCYEPFVQIECASVLSSIALDDDHRSTTLKVIGTVDALLVSSERIVCWLRADDTR